MNAAESDYKSTASAFELKNCLGHLRSFLEHPHRESVKSIAAAAGQTVVDRWGDATLYLRQQGYFTKQHKTFITSVYTLLSDESVHPLTGRPRVCKASAKCRDRIRRDVPDCAR